MRQLTLFILLIGCVSLFIAGCDVVEDIVRHVSEDENANGLLIDPTEFDEEYSGPIDSADFVAVVDNPYWPLTLGTTLIYEGETEDGPERIVVEVIDDTKVILGVTCTVVRDRVFLDGELIEDTLDWYAQDTEGNVWYFGEDSKEIEDGQVVDTAGSWEAGVAGATPGIIMKGDPEVGDQYRQEFFAGEAEDMAKILSLNESVTVAAGSFDNCWQIMEWSALEPEVVAHKFYAPGVGSILEIHVEGDLERVELVEIRNE